MNTTIVHRLKDAAELGDINLFYTLIQEDPYILEYIDSIPFVETPLHIAASLGHLYFAAEIMRLKPSFAWKLNPQGLSPINLAIEKSQRNMVVQFVDINKDLVRIKGREGLTPLHFASQIGEIDLLATFLSACPDSIEDVTMRNETALHIAVKNKQYEALQVLVGWLKRTHQKSAMQLEKTILNWGDEGGNTVLHIATLISDLQAIRLLVNTKMDLKAKNKENSTALDIATNTEIKSILCSNGAKHGSSLTSPPTLANKLKSPVTIMDKILIFIFRVRRDISEEQRNAFLIVAALVATTTFQSALSPPGGVYQADAGYITANTTSTSINSTERIAGTSVMGEGDFFTLFIFNTVSLGVSIITIYILTPSGIVGSVLITPIFYFACCYLYGMRVISPTSATSVFSLIMLSFFCVLYSVVFWTFIVYKRIQGDTKNWEI